MDTKYPIILAVVVLVVVVGTVLTQSGQGSDSVSTEGNVVVPSANDDSSGGGSSGDEVPTEPMAPAWMNVELTDVSSGERFRISDFKGKPILLESFAVWCPTCLSQQKEMKILKQQEGESVIHISLDTDSNEDVGIVKGHVERNGLDWYFAVAPTELTNALIDEFGLSIVNAPGAPVVVICEDLSTRFLGSGVKSASDLKSEIAKGC